MVDVELYLKNKVMKRWKNPAIFLLSILAIFSLDILLTINPIGATQNKTKKAFESQNNFDFTFKQGKQYYEQTNFSQALILFKSSYNISLIENNIYNQAKALNFIAMTYHKLAKWDDALLTIDQNIELLESQSNLNQNMVFLLEQAFNVKGNIHFSMSKIKAALFSWQKAEKEAEKISDFEGIQGSLINQVTAYYAMGQYLKGNKILRKLEQKIEQQEDSQIKVYSLLSLGIALQKQGDLKQSELILRKSLTLSEQVLSANKSDQIKLSLANTLKKLNKVDEALKYYQEVIKTATNQEIKVKAKLNQLEILINQKKWQKVSYLVHDLEQELTVLLPSRNNIYAKINYVQSLLKISKITNQDYSKKILDILTPAFTQAQNLQDNRSESYVYGVLGKLYLHKGRIKEAQQLTEKALIKAEIVNAKDITVHWQAQMGKLYQQQGNIQQAVSFYKSAVNNLESLSQDLYSNNAEVQFSFRENVEPIYRQLIDLLLVDENPSKENIKLSIDVFEKLHIAELKNFFGDGCLVSKSPEEINDKKAAIIYPIILPNRLVIITSLPNENYAYSSVDIAQSELEALIIQTRNSLHPTASNHQREKLTQQLYSWLVQPLESQLQNNQIKTLVFALDGVMRNLPMVSLYDGENYLLEKYAIAVIPVRVDFLDPQPWQTKQLDVLVGGLSESRQGFSSLPSVESEVNQISNLSQGEVLFNDNFTQENIQQLIKQNPFPVVHLATHGQFSSQRENTFLVAWNETINIRELEKIIKNRNTNNVIELLVLSACQTASGDNRAALGLAGLAMRSGARSVVATLWSVNDESTSEFMVNFYQQLQLSGVSKSEALRQAQLKLLRSPQYNHPYYWSPFIIIGNWL